MDLVDSTPESEGGDEAALALADEGGADEGRRIIWREA